MTIEYLALAASAVVFCLVLCGVGVAVLRSSTSRGPPGAPGLPPAPSRGVQAMSLTDLIDQHATATEQRLRRQKLDERIAALYTDTVAAPPAPDPGPKAP